MNAGEISEHPPIYDRLVKERGDVLAETRRVAEQAQLHAQQALDWSGLRPSPQQNVEQGERAFSAFGWASVGLTPSHVSFRRHRRCRVAGGSVGGSGTRGGAVISGAWVLLAGLEPAHPGLLACQGLFFVIERRTLAQDRPLNYVCNGWSSTESSHLSDTAPMAELSV
jgi:hypothetical protein